MRSSASKSSGLVGKLDRGASEGSLGRESLAAMLQSVSPPEACNGY